MNFRFILMLLLIVFSFQINAQIVSQFSWDSGGPVTDADIGPDGISVSASAISDVGGVGGTNGLNAGLPKRDVVLVIPGSPTFDINGIDVSFDYQREESGGTFVQRGASLVIQGCANLAVSYRVDDGGGSYNTLSSGNVYAIPFDDTYRNYRFTYLPSTGRGELSVDGVVVWFNDGPDARNLYWTSSGNLNIGVGMDGTGYDNTFLDNLIIGEIFDSPLPIELLYFEANSIDNQHVHCTWATATERNNEYFNIERSSDGENWSTIGNVVGAMNSNSLIEYDFIDYLPLLGTSYYRLKQVDLNGDFEYSEPHSVVFETEDETQLLIYPNPSNDVLNIRATTNFSEIQIFDVYGRVIQTITMNVSESWVKSYTIDLNPLAKGTYFLKVNNTTKVFVRN